jgi:hypothetical protein
MEIGAVSTPAMRGNRYFLARREGTQNTGGVYILARRLREGKIACSSIRPRSIRRV